MLEVPAKRIGLAIATSRELGAAGELDAAVVIDPG
jgi:hypothetical protein